MRLALRALARTPGFTITAVLSLAPATGASAAAFAVIDAVRFRALPFPAGDRLVLLSEVPIDEGPEAEIGRSARATTGRDCRVACDVSYETFDQVLTRSCGVTRSARRWAAPRDAWVVTCCATRPRGPARRAGDGGCRNSW